MLNQDGCHAEGCWKVVRQAVSPCGPLPRTPSSWWWLISLHVLPGPPGIKQLMQMPLWRLARAAVSVGALPPIQAPQSLPYCCHWRNLHRVSSTPHSTSSRGAEVASLLVWTCTRLCAPKLGVRALPVLPTAVFSPQLIYTVFSANSVFVERTRTCVKSALKPNYLGPVLCISRYRFPCHRGQLLVPKPTNY